MVGEVMPVKDEVQAAVPHGWRGTLGAIIDSLIRGDARIGQGVEGVDPVSEDGSKLWREIVADYGPAALIQLPEATWQTSVALWQGDRWDCLVDLWNAEDGRTDLVLDVAVFEDDETVFRFRPHLVYVP